MRRAVIIVVAAFGLSSAGCVRQAQSHAGCRVSSAQMMIEFMQEAADEEPQAPPADARSGVGSK